ncbi:radical SAM/SPASM domain-containing protein [Desulfofustis limnaeus]|uniref:Radical SAM core domain-containing protein n=1 Tax=Desulfofustis limnaeus TaxID=2740163 RepID=A0ABN6M442_9BACT|nr:radical SAM protein [Desulfofustis limnaeus]BDD87668.1 hypothetical protein DPPLL_20330 [Desulfofustis limnaeus]
MSTSYVQTQSLPDFDLWQKKREKHSLISFTLEITARCNNNCRHCYINLPEDDQKAKAEELTFEEIKHIVDQAVDLGAVWCLITGGEPLLREDFEEIYLYLKRKGLLVSVFTNATLITQKHIDLFKKYPPRNLEVTVYGITQQTYTAVTRKPELFSSFKDGIDRLLQNKIPVDLKNVTIKANLEEFATIAAFCRKHSNAPFRFDPLLHLRFDRDEKQNEEIRNQRLTPEEIAVLECSDKVRFSALTKNCDKLVLSDRIKPEKPYLFTCGAGLSDFVVSYNGNYRLCSSLWHPDCMQDLRNTSVSEAKTSLTSKIRNMQTDSRDFLEKCGVCPLINFCIWCPAHAYLETGVLELACSYFCEVAERRYGNLTYGSIKKDYLNTEKTYYLTSD